MTQPSHPKNPKSSRKKPGREPATIDLKATVIDDGALTDAAKDKHWDGVKPEETNLPDAERPPENSGAGLDATLDSASGSDSIASAVAPQEPLAPETIGGDVTVQSRLDQDGLNPDSPGHDLLSRDTLGQHSLGQDTLGRETLDHGSLGQASMGQDSLGQGSLDQDSPGPDSLAQEPLTQETAAQEPPAYGGPPPGGSARSTPERRTSPAALIGSGLLGGLVGAGLVYALQLYGPQTARAPAPQDDQRLARLEQRVGALGQQGAPQGNGQGNLQALEGRLQALEAARGAVDQRLQAVQGTAEQAAARAEEAANRPVPPAPAPQNDAALTELSGRLSALEGQLSTVQGQVRTAAESATGATQAMQALERRIAEQDQRAAERERRLGEQDQRLSALSQQVTQENQGAEAASQAGIRVILSERLGEALRNGTPYGEVLEGLRKADTDATRLAALEPFAGAGAPTAAALAQSFKPIGATILRDERAASGAWGDRLLRMMDQVVTVRPVNEPGSTGVPSIVARIEGALAGGRVAEAVAAWETLPEPARRQSEEWGRQVKAVAQAHAASQAIASDALAALNKTAQ